MSIIHDVILLTVHGCASVFRFSNSIPYWASKNISKIFIIIAPVYSTIVLDNAKHSSARRVYDIFKAKLRQESPSPSTPVVYPAELRLMWVPDHLDELMDYVPDHYYYLKVTNDVWLTNDPYYLEKQLFYNPRKAEDLPRMYKHALQKNTPNVNTIK